MNFCFASRKEHDPKTEVIIQRLYQADYPVTFGNLDYWCCLYNNDDEIIAECSVSRVNKYRSYYYIADVYVTEKFRGNGYAVALILNVIYSYDQLGISGPFELCAYSTNLSAQRCYNKIFGNPSYKKYNLVYYSIN